MPPLGVVLAAGAGRRYGGPKAFVRADTGETWLERACRVLLDGGCDEVLATVPAGSDPALPAEVTPIPLATDGLSDSLRAALTAAAEREAQAVVVLLVDLPDVTAEVVRHVLEVLEVPGVGPATLARATYAGRPGHPVVIGSAHFAALLAELRGDSGANAYLTARDAAGIECGDLATGRDVDRPS